VGRRRRRDLSVVKSALKGGDAFRFGEKERPVDVREIRAFFSI